jgi:hypothetical protein
VKIKSMKLTSGWPNPQDPVNRPEFRLYRVERVNDSVEVNPGDFLTRGQVKDYCSLKTWTVTITEKARDT